MSPGRGQARDALVRKPAAIDLLDQRSAAVGDDHARDGLQQDAILIRNLFGGAHEDAAGAVDRIGFGAGGDQSHDQVPKPLPVADMVFIPDHQVDHEALQPPVRVAADQLARQVDIARYPRSSAARWAGRRKSRSPTGRTARAGSACSTAGVGTQRRIGVEHGAGQAPVKRGIAFGRVDLPQRHAAVRPCRGRMPGRRNAGPGTSRPARRRPRGSARRRTPGRPSPTGQARARSGSGWRRSDPAPILRCRTARQRHPGRAAPRSCACARQSACDRSRRRLRRRWRPGS